MQPKAFLTLCGATAVAVAAAYFALQQGAGEPARASDDGVLFEGLVERVNDVARVSISADDQTVTLAKGAAGWSLEERGGYPIDFTKVKEMVMAVARLEIQEPKTSKPENHATLGVQEPAPGESSKLVRLLDGAGAAVAEVVVGDTKTRGRSKSVFVRRAGEDQVFACKGDLAVETDPTKWLEKDLLRIERDQLVEAEITHADGSVVLVRRNEENTNQFDLVNPPEGREVSFEGAANSVGTAINYLALDDVRPAADVDMTVEPISQTIYRCANGMLLDLQISKSDEKHWVVVKAAYDAIEVVGPMPGPPVDPEDPENPDGAEHADGATGDLAQAGEAAARAQIDEINGRCSGWVFAIPDYKAEVIARKMEDLLKELPGEGEEEDAAASPFGPGPGMDGAGIDGIDPGELPLSLQELMQGLEQDPQPAETPAPATEGQTSEDSGDESGVPVDEDEDGAPR